MVKMVSGPIIVNINKTQPEIFTDKILIQKSSSWNLMLKALCWMGANIFDKNSSLHCVKIVGIRSYSGLHFSAFGLNTERFRMPENADQKNSEYGHFLRSEYFNKSSSEKLPDLN